MGHMHPKPRRRTGAPDDGRRQLTRPIRPQSARSGPRCAPARCWPPRRARPRTATSVVSETSTRRPVQSSYSVAMPNRLASSTSEGASSVMPPILLPGSAGDDSAVPGCGCTGRCRSTARRADEFPSFCSQLSNMFAEADTQQDELAMRRYDALWRHEESGRGTVGIQKVPAQWRMPLLSSVPILSS